LTAGCNTIPKEVKGKHFAQLLKELGLISSTLPKATTLVTSPSSTTLSTDISDTEEESPFRTIDSSEDLNLLNEEQYAKDVSNSAANGTKPVNLWTSEEVTKWLQTIELEQYAQIFRENFITGEELLHILTSQSDLLLHLKIPLGHISKLQRCIRDLIDK